MASWCHSVIISRDNAINAPEEGTLLDEEAFFLGEEAIILGCDVSYRRAIVIISGEDAIHLRPGVSNFAAGAIFL